MHGSCIFRYNQRFISDNHISFTISPENLILTADHKTVKLADFGLAREESLTEMMTAETGTYRWMAPEVLYSNMVSLSHNYLFVSHLIIFYDTYDPLLYLVTALQHGHIKAR